ncbi:hypothetical protein VZT92_005978 [Zoarces viviparus]|uniref:Uncharacterized protein n=1 Tax=Zoarces viviparus TaxID=48416 RepID=A0AAW1FN60_ZOAVI
MARKCMKRQVNTCGPPVDVERVDMQVKTERQRSQRAHYKPWLEESTLSSQSAADSTGRDEEREESTDTITG